MVTMPSPMQLRIFCADMAASRCDPDRDRPSGLESSESLDRKVPPVYPAIVGGWNGTNKRPHVTSVKVSVGLLQTNGNSSCLANARSGLLDRLVMCADSQS